MPYRRLPNTDQARVRALKAAVEKGEMYNVRDLAITLKTLFEARNFLHRFEAAQIYYTAPEKSPKWERYSGWYTALIAAQLRQQDATM